MQGRNSRQFTENPCECILCSKGAKKLSDNSRDGVNQQLPGGKRSLPPLIEHVFSGIFLTDISLNLDKHMNVEKNDVWHKAAFTKKI